MNLAAFIIIPTLVGVLPALITDGECINVIEAEVSPGKGPAVVNQKPAPGREKNEQKEERYRVLAFLPIASKSHHRVWQPLLRELATRGHHVTYVSPIPLDDPPANFKHISLGTDIEFLEKTMNKAGFNATVFTSLRGIPNHFMSMVMLRRIGLAMSEVTLEDPQVKALIQSDQRFDAVITESTFVQEVFVALQHRFDAVGIEMETCGNWHWGYWMHGNPLDTSYIVDISVPFSDRMTLYEKIINTVNSLITRIQWQVWYMPQYEQLMNRMIRYPGWRSRPPMMDMLRNTSVVLINAHYSLNYPYPMAPNFKEVGGLNLVPVKPLPKELQEFMDGAEDGVIYFTMGSFLQVSSVIGEKLGPIFIKVFSQVKQRVLMKWETQVPNLPSNVITSKWFPQQDVLAHKNMRMFISHGGLLSMTESANQGVPILGIPMMGDQSKNIKHVVHYEYGLELDIENITESSLSWAVNEIINDPKYGENAKKRSQLFRDKPQTALETAVYWTEYAIRHKGAHHLRPAIASMPWYQQAMIDVYAAIALMILIPLYLFKKILCCTCRLISRLGGKKQNQTSKTKKTQ